MIVWIFFAQTPCQTSAPLDDSYELGTAVVDCLVHSLHQDSAELYDPKNGS